MDLSIIIPCHNLENYIFPLLNSFCSIRLKGLKVEFIFVLDSCTDNTESIVKECMDGFDYSIYSCDFHSVGLARNLGFSKSTGKYIWFVDGDDWLIYPDTIIDCLNILEIQDIPIIQLKFISNFFNIEFYSMVWQYIFRRDLIEDIKFVEEQPHEDCIFMRQIFHKLNTRDITYYKIPSYFYNYKRPGSNMTQYNETKIVK